MCVLFTQMKEIKRQKNIKQNKNFIILKVKNKKQKTCLVKIIVLKITKEKYRSNELALPTLWRRKIWITNEN